MKPTIKKITCDHGGEAQYTAIPWAGGYGVEMMRRLTPIISKALSMMDAIKGGDSLKKLMAGGLLDADAGEALASIAGEAGAAISQTLTGIGEAIAAEGDADLLRACLMDVIRVYDGQTYKVSHSHDFDRAYQANYFEMVQAIIFSLKTNYGPSLKFLLSRSKKK